MAKRGRPTTGLNVLRTTVNLNGVRHCQPLDEIVAAVAKNGNPDFSRSQFLRGLIEGVLAWEDKECLHHLLSEGHLARFITACLKNGYTGLDMIRETLIAEEAGGEETQG